MHYIRHRKKSIEITSRFCIIMAIGALFVKGSICLYGGLPHRFPVKSNEFEKKLEIETKNDIHTHSNTTYASYDLIIIHFVGAMGNIIKRNKK